MWVPGSDFTVTTSYPYGRFLSPVIAAYICNGVLQQLQAPWVSATLHENFEKMPFCHFGVIDDADLNGGSLTVLRLQFPRDIQPCNILQHLCNICNNFEILHTGVFRSPEFISDDGDALFLAVLVLSAFEISAALEFSSNRCNVLHPDSYRRIYIVRLASACQRIGLHCLGKVTVVLVTG